MTDDPQHLVTAESIVISVQFLAGTVMAGLGWWVKRQDARIGNLEKDLASKVSLEVHNQTLEALRKEIRESGKEQTEMLSRTHNRIDDLLKHLIENK